MEKTLPIDMKLYKPTWQPWILLLARTVLFAAFQVLIALGYFLGGISKAWEASAAWWPFTVTMTNLVCIVLLSSLFRKEGSSYLGLFRIHREHLKDDLLNMLWVMVITLPIAFLPNILLATWLFGDINTALHLFIRHLPAWAAYSGFLLFPVTQGMAELVTYFMYIEPHLEGQIKNRWLALSSSAVALGIQHIAVPLIFNGPFLLWRALMFIPFAFMLGIILRWRPRLLPYLVIMHILLDLGTAAMLLTA